MNIKTPPLLNNWSINLKEKFDWLAHQPPYKLEYPPIPDGYLIPKSVKPTGIKNDSDKDPVELLDPLALEGLAKVLAFGAKKYAKHNWRGGLSYTRLIGAALRHTFEILKGKDIDPESGLPHVDHLGCCWMFLSNMMKTRPDMDDRWKGTK